MRRPESGRSTGPRRSRITALVLIPVAILGVLTAILWINKPCCPPPEPDACQMVLDLSNEVTADASKQAAHSYATRMQDSCQGASLLASFITDGKATSACPIVRLDPAVPQNPVEERRQQEQMWLTFQARIEEMGTCVEAAASGHVEPRIGWPDTSRALSAAADSLRGFPGSRSLFMVGDFEALAPSGLGKKGPATYVGGLEAEGLLPAFDSTEVVLIPAAVGEAVRPARAAEVEDFWTAYFEASGATRVEGSAPLV